MIERKVKEFADSLLMDMSYDDRMRALDPDYEITIETSYNCCVRKTRFVVTEREGERYKYRDEHIYERIGVELGLYNLLMAFYKYLLGLRVVDDSQEIYKVCDLVNRVLASPPTKALCDTVYLRRIIRAYGLEHKSS